MEWLDLHTVSLRLETSRKEGDSNLFGMTVPIADEGFAKHIVNQKLSAGWDSNSPTPLLCSVRAGERT